MPGRTLLADRLRDELLEEITSSQLQPGTKLPTEGELSKRFGVSRATVREAVGGLVEAGYVTRRRGSGSYVAERRRMPHGLDSTLSYLAMIESAGAHAGMRVLDAVFEQSGKIDGPLQLNRGEEVLAVERVRTADEQPVICSRYCDRPGTPPTMRRRRCMPWPAPASRRRCWGFGAASRCSTSRRPTTTATERRSCCRGSGMSPRHSTCGSTGRPSRRRSPRCGSGLMV